MPGAREIKRNSKRTVRREPEKMARAAGAAGVGLASGASGAGNNGEDGLAGMPERAIKRFHAPGPWDRLRDGARARAEARALREARSRGLPVPRVLELARRSAPSAHGTHGTHGTHGNRADQDRALDRCAVGGTGNRWELATEWIPGALPLAEILRGTAPWPRGRRAGLRALGRLLARIFEAGLRHSDLHPGNVIFDGEGRAFLVDLRGARFERRPTPPPTILDGTRTDQLIALVAATREMLTPGERSLVLGELVRGLEGQATPPATWRRRVEDEARILRRARCRRRLRVWFRSSKPTSEFDAGSGRALRRRDLSLELARAWVLDDQLPTAEGDYSYTGHAYPSSSATRRAWAAAALAEEHHLDAARPAACDLRGARILYRVPRDSRPLTAESARSEHAAALGQLIGSLHDRGLSASLEPGAILCTASDSTLLLAPGFDPRPVDPQPLGPQPLHASQRWDELSASCTALGLDLSAAPAFQDAYLAAQRHSHEERAELRANWGHG